MQDEVKSMIREYYHVIGLKPDRSRKQEQVKARAAMMSALRHSRLTVHLIGKIFDTDHSTVVHHTNKHEANLASWPGYERNYIAAVRMCSSNIESKAWEFKLREVKVSIARLNRVKERLEEAIKSKRYE